MEGIAILVNAGLLYTAYGLAFYSLILLVKLMYNYVQTKDKALVKEKLKKLLL